ncbi:SusE domain-containing protein [Flavobacterium sp. LC2016-12]|uniref:SusE domain-containing protein n=1 Tax=Flavobacterium sp. LC2016-12 TaxID=2783794 RepID=UPI00188A9835|nr:SusE domain-containing protein [Flavobacterium sp. LC2016-12]MBF4464646.1 SusE domain-containing protein [Flavobacterium sp. LC2016-12]
MKKYINKLFVLGSLLFLAASCETDGQLTTLAKVSFPSAIEVSSKTIVLKEDESDQQALLVSWPKVTYPIAAPVTYALQFDLTTDVKGSEAWGKAKRVEVGEDVLSKSFTVFELNKIATELGLKPNVAGELVIRVESSMDHRIYSNPVTITVTPYEKVVVFGEIYMPGSYQGWGIETAAALTEIQVGIYQGYMTVPEGAGPGFKLNRERNWAQFFGAGASNADLKNMSDTDLTLPGAGSYQIKVNLNTLKWSGTPYSWGIVGTATAGSWDASTPMSYDHQNKTWKITTTLLPGALKFRLNNSWDVNYGPADASTDTINLGNTAAYSIGLEGTYEVTFKINEVDPLSNGYPATATCTIVKK